MQTVHFVHQGYESRNSVLNGTYSCCIVTLQAWDLFIDVDKLKELLMR